MIDLTSDTQFAALIQNNAFPNDFLTFIHDYMQQIRSSLEDEFFPPSGQWFFVLESTDQLTLIQPDQTAFSCSADTYFPEYIERYTFDDGSSLYKIFVMLDNECSMTFFTFQGIHSAEAERWLLANAYEVH